MADLDDMEMMKCPHCGREAPRDFFPLCSCERDIKEENKPPKKPAKPVKPEEREKSEGDPYKYDW